MKITQVHKMNMNRIYIYIFQILSTTLLIYSALYSFYYLYDNKYLLVQIKFEMITIALLLYFMVLKKELIYLNLSPIKCLQIYDL